MPIEDRNLGPGTRLVARYRKQDRTCDVVQTDDGLRYRLDDDTEHKSPSSAGKAVVGHACNGWVFWSLAGAERPARKPKAAAKPKKSTAKTAPSTKGKRPAKKAGGKRAAKPKTARAASEGDSYGCGACPETFPTMKAATAHALTHTTGD